MAFRRSYTIAQATKLIDRRNYFDTEDGYKITLIKEVDPIIGPIPALHMSIGSVQLAGAILPESEAGIKAVAHRLLTRLKLADLVGDCIQMHYSKTRIQLWYLVPKWAHQQLQPIAVVPTR